MLRPWARLDLGHVLSGPLQSSRRPQDSKELRYGMVDKEPRTVLSASGLRRLQQCNLLATKKHHDETKHNEATMTVPSVYATKTVIFHIRVEAVSDSEGFVKIADGTSLVAMQGSSCFGLLTFQLRGFRHKVRRYNCGIAELFRKLSGLNPEVSYLPRESTCLFPAAVLRFIWLTESNSIWAFVADEYLDARDHVMALDVRSHSACLTQDSVGSVL